MVIFTEEETDLISCYWKKGDTKLKLLTQIRRAFPDMDAEMKQLGQRAIKKLEMMSENQYIQTYFIHSEIEE